MAQDRGTPSQSLRNLFQPMPHRRRLALLAKNYWIRARTLSLCCGNPGEPGC
jgi:hypothetical protein